MAGDKIMFKAGKTLLEDETVSPAFECAMWALEKLDPRLPNKCKNDFGFRMEGNVTCRCAGQVLRHYPP